MLDLDEIKQSLSSTPKPWIWSPDGGLADTQVDLTALIEELEHYKKQVAELVDPDKAELVSFVDGVFSFKSPVFETLLAGVVQMLDQSGAKNYVDLQMELGGPPEKSVVLTLQRKEGKTAHQLRVEADAECARLRKALQQLVAACVEGADADDVNIAVAVAKEALDA
jgi:hypothetical protein